MGYKLFDANGCDVTQHDLQDKSDWCRTGASKEVVFIEKYGAELNLIINPVKKNNPYAPDLLNLSNKRLADLKTQNTPFFQARSRFGYDPQFTVVFNAKDRLRYKEKYPDIEIYFAVDWQIVKFQGKSTIEVDPMAGVWFIPFGELDKLLDKAPLHTYQQRRFDQIGNAKESYLLNLLDSGFSKLK